MGAWEFFQCFVESCAEVGSAFFELCAGGLFLFAEIHGVVVEVEGFGEGGNGGEFVGVGDAVDFVDAVFGLLYKFEGLLVLVKCLLFCFVGATSKGE